MKKFIQNIFLAIVIIVLSLTICQAQIKGYKDSSNKYQHYWHDSLKVNAMWMLLPQSYWQNDSNRYKTIYRFQLDVMNNFKRLKAINNRKHNHNK